MKQRYSLLISVLLSLVLVNAIELFSQEPDSTSYPKTSLHRWGFATLDEGRGGTWQKENDDQFPYERPGWHDSKTEFLRRFDFVEGAMTHIMSFNDNYTTTNDYYTDGKTLSHYHFEHYYDHDDYNGGSAQDLLAKSKWVERRHGKPQVVLGSYAPQKLESGHLRNPA
jgi:hypothetical protein